MSVPANVKAVPIVQGRDVARPDQPDGPMCVFAPLFCCARIEDRVQSNPPVTGLSNTRSGRPG